LPLWLVAGYGGKELSNILEWEPNFQKERPIGALFLKTSDSALHRHAS